MSTSKSNIPDQALAQFSMYIDKAVYNREEQEFRWHCVASDVEEDVYTDNMTLGLFEKFLARIDSKESPPEKYCSSFWSGGKPYPAISHYSDQNGKAVPGETECVYVDGDKLKAKGKFFKTPLGLAVFDAINRDKTGVKRSDLDNPVRISIAFLDYAHKHKSNGEVFERKSLDDICPWCILESISGDGKGKEYLDGHLIHLAFTRVPVNKRTDVEVEMAKVTRKDDAESIVGDLAEVLDVQEEQFRSEVLVTMSEEIPEESAPDKVVEVKATVSDDEEEEETPVDKKKKKKKVTEEKSHVLQDVLESYRSAFDKVVDAEASTEEKLQAMQPYMEELANVTRSSIQKFPPLDSQSQMPELEAFRSQVNAQFTQINGTLALLQQLLETKSTIHDAQVPTPRSFQPPIMLVPTVQPAQDGKPIGLREVIRSSVGLNP
jgi:hypothetical protein